MINVSLSARALAAARSVDPHVSPAAVHAAVEIAVAEQLRAVAEWPAARIRAKAEAIAEEAFAPPVA